MKTGLLVAVAVCLMGTASTAWACPVTGKVVCPGTTAPAQGVEVIFTAISGYAFENPFYCSPVSDVTDEFGIFDGHLCGGVYSVNLDPLVTVTCDGSSEGGIDLTGTPFEGEGLNCAPPPPPEADCSPGFYKKNTDAWCPNFSSTTFTCQDGNVYTCAELVCLLSAEPPCRSNAIERAFAKGCLDSKFTPDICPNEY
jgi:hypothetical protein